MSKLNIAIVKKNNAHRVTSIDGKTVYEPYDPS